MSTNRTIERTSRSPVSWFGILKSCCVLTPFLVATDTVCSCESRWAVETCRIDCRLRDDKCPEQSVNAGSLPSSAKYHHVLALRWLANGHANQIVIADCD